jgi:phosphatidylserine synthase
MSHRIEYLQHGLTMRAMMAHYLCAFGLCCCVSAIRLANSKRVQAECPALWPGANRVLTLSAGTR